MIPLESPHFEVLLAAALDAPSPSPGEVVIIPQSEKSQFSSFS